ncbi:mitochondrial 54S ribosomal protein YmL31 [Flammula alnicola]|nr:mitochondrial 54S ribosomal protein YmL31 [Flammula alnicola]
MFGAFRPTNVNLEASLEDTMEIICDPEANARSRLKKVDAVIEAVRASGVQTASLARALELPKEHEMHARDKYTVFSPHAKGYRKGIHKVPKWTRLTLRTNPKGF